MNNDLNKLSLLAFIDIANVFNGLYMTPHLRVWYIRVDVRLNPRLTFELKNSDFDTLISEALERVIDYHKKYYPEFLEDK